MTWVLWLQTFSMNDNHRDIGEVMKQEISKAISSTAYQAYEKLLFKEVSEGVIPHHIAVIMDGNRRFAKELGISSTEGHIKGKDKLEEVLEWCMELDIKVLTVYAFSTENGKRSIEEVSDLMDLFEDNFIKLADDDRVHRYGIKVKVLGQRELIPANVLEAIEVAEEKTKDYSDHYYNIALAYGSRQEIIHAIKQIAQKVKDGEMEIEDICEDTVSTYLYTADFPDPDLVLRTSGEERVSNFLLCQLAYSELYFTDVYWPGFRKIDFLRAIRSYQLRQRRFGT